MKQIDDPISKATDRNAAPAERHEAFGALVVRFQDMAFGCAYAVLGDSFLAEDVAQEAFVVAWQKLDQLRDPKAFPGWLKRIVLTQCNRVTRRKRLQFVPLELGENSATSEPGPHVIAEEQELMTKVLSAIKSLPENERLATTLFYVNGYTQTDIGDFLEMPVSTVNKRLYTARQRLKLSMVDVFKDSLKRRRPSRDRSFSDRVNANLRPLANQDWPPIKTMAYARQHSDGPGNEISFEKKFALPTPGMLVRGCLDECDICEPALQKEIELDLERKRLENEKLKREIELMDKDQAHRCCPEGEEIDD